MIWANQHAEGRLLAAADHDRKIVIRTVEDGALVRTLEGHANAVLSIAFSPDRQWLASLLFECMACDGQNR
jgi:WD40 repeat protein